MITPIERLWGVMHGHFTPNKCYATFARSRTAMLAVPNVKRGLRLDGRMGVKISS